MYSVGQSFYVYRRRLKTLVFGHLVSLSFKYFLFIFTLSHSYTHKLMHFWNSMTNDRSLIACGCIIIFSFNKHFRYICDEVFDFGAMNLEIWIGLKLNNAWSIVMIPMCSMIDARIVKFILRLFLFDSQKLS